VLLEELLQDLAGVDTVVERQDCVHFPMGLKERDVCKKEKKK
jgi:hypothetical protein